MKSSHETQEVGEKFQIVLSIPSLLSSFTLLYNLHFSPYTIYIYNTPPSQDGQTHQIDPSCRKISSQPTLSIQHHLFAPFITTSSTYLASRVYIWQTNYSFVQLFFNEVMINLYVFGQIMLNWIITYIYSYFVITIQHQGLTFK